MQITWTPGQSFESEAEKNEKERHRFVSIVDVVCLGRSLRLGELSLAIESIKDEFTVFVDQAGNSVDKIEPRFLIELLYVRF